jgi:hypothetical protein
MTFSSSLLLSCPAGLPPFLLPLHVQSVIQVFTLAFLVVGATCVAMIPIMLYILDLREWCTAPWLYCSHTCTAHLLCTAHGLNVLQSAAAPS